jgi:hypothetical protein
MWFFLPAPWYRWFQGQSPLWNGTWTLESASSFENAHVVNRSASASMHGESAKNPGKLRGDKKGVVGTFGRMKDDLRAEIVENYTIHSSDGATVPLPIKESGHEPMGGVLGRD